MRPLDPLGICSTPLPLYCENSSELLPTAQTLTYSHVRATDLPQNNVVELSESPGPSIRAQVILSFLEGCPQAIHHVPPEIWAEIFTCAYDAVYKVPFRDPVTAGQTQGVTFSSTPDSLNPRNILHIIRRVCRSWREIVESVSKLWSSIWFQDCWKLLQNARKDLPGFLSSRSYTLSNVLKFSQNLPLRIGLFPGVNRNATPLVHHIMMLLSQHVHRWENLSIHETPDQAVGRALTSSLSLLGNIRPDFPNLQRLRYQWKGQIIDGEEQEVAFSLQKPLRWLSVGPVCPPPYALSWDSIQSVTFHKVRLHDFRRVFPLLTSAVEILIDGWVINGGIVDNQALTVGSNMREFVLPRLKTLTVSEWDTNFFAFMKAPNLRHLRLHRMLRHEREIAQFISHSMCPIESFTCYQAVPLTHPSIPHHYSLLFYSMPELRRLCFRVGYTGDNLDSDKIHMFLDALGGTQAAEDGLDIRAANCSNLQHLAIHLKGLDNYPEAFRKLTREIEARWQATRNSPDGLGLRRVDVGVMGMPDDHERFPEEYQACFQRIRAMELEGLRVSYR